MPQKQVVSHTSATLGTNGPWDYAWGPMVVLGGGGCLFMSEVSLYAPLLPPM